jgi:hypothetical protein
MKSILLASTISTFACGAAIAADISAYPCRDLLGLHGTSTEPDLSALVAGIGARNNRIGSNINIETYLLTECRLNVSMTLGQAAMKVLADARANRLPPIPIGGATADPAVKTDWDRFEIWLKAGGPQPHYQGR